MIEKNQFCSARIQKNSKDQNQLYQN